MAIEQSKIDRIIELAKIYGATRLILFGSMVKIPIEKGVDLLIKGLGPVQAIRFMNILKK